ncbi:MAG: fatty acid hydroxylase, partial [Polaromonas sp.]|nr:fatty acid hydroxylase [Polaromonas sp.]
MGQLSDLFLNAQQALYESAVQPLLFAAGLGNLLEDGFAATAWLLVGLLKIGVLIFFICPFHRCRPVEALTDRASIRTD